MNEVYKSYFPTEPPTRSTVGVSGLARPEFVVEIEAVDAVTPVHPAQLTLLKLSGKFVGLRINFNVVHLRHRIRRMVQGDSLSPCPQWLRPWFPPKDRLACCGGFVQSGDARGVGCIQHHLGLFLNFFGD